MRKGKNDATESCEIKMQAVYSTLRSSWFDPYYHALIFRSWHG